MITLTRLNSHPITINSDLIRFVEASPDTMLTLVTAEKIVVLESCEEVVARAMSWRAGLLRAAFPGGLSPLAGEAASSAAASASANMAAEAFRKLSTQGSE